MFHDITMRANNCDLFSVDCFGTLTLYQTIKYGNNNFCLLQVVPQTTHCSQTISVAFPNTALKSYAACILQSWTGIYNIHWNTTPATICSALALKLYSGKCPYMITNQVNCTLIYIKVTNETKIAFLINKCMVVCSYQNTRSEIITKTRSTHVLTLSGSTMKMSIYSALRTE